jgi:hypothetical protein
MNGLKTDKRTTLRVTPAMEAGLTDHVWRLEELVELMNCEVKK